MSKDMSKDYINWLDASLKERGSLFANIFTNYLNSATRQEMELSVKTMLRGHRTLQQDVFRFCLDYIKGMSKEKFYDLRNEFSVKTAKEIMEFLESKDLGTHAPLI